MHLASPDALRRMVQYHSKQESWNGVLSRTLLLEIRPAFSCSSIFEQLAASLGSRGEKVQAIEMRKFAIQAIVVEPPAGVVVEK